MCHPSTSQTFPINDVEKEEIDELIATLGIVERASKSLSRADFTVSDADIAIEVSQ